MTAPDMDPGVFGREAYQEESEASFNHENKSSQIPQPFKTVSKLQDCSLKGR